MNIRGVRVKIILGFCLLMLAGGAVSITVVDATLQHALVESSQGQAVVLAATLARQLSGPVEEGDWERVDYLIDAEGEHCAWVALVAPDGRVRHSGSVEIPPNLTERTDSRIVNAGDTKVIDVSAALADPSSGLVHVGMSLEPAIMASRAVIRSATISTLITMLLGVVAIAVFATLLTRPIRRLTAAARRLGQGDLDTEVPATGGHDEIADLAHSFGEMARQVRVRIEESDRLRAYFEQLLDEMPSGVLVRGSQGQIQFLNRAARDAMGPIDEDHPPGAGTLRKAIDALQERQVRAPSRATMSWTNPAGRTFDIVVMPLPSDGPEPLTIATMNDVTENHLLADHLRRAERLAVAGELAAGVVHAVNNPLDGVRRAIALARRDETDVPRVAEMLEIAQIGTDRIATVTKSLLRYARALGKDARDYRDPGAIVQEASQLVMLRAEQREVSLELDLGAELPEVAMDARSMVEVVVNLMVNAVDAAGPGGVVVASVRRGGEQSVEISVADDGPGVPPELRDRIFEPFFTTKEPDLGTGLGLSFARRVVEAHGGQIVLASDRPRGSEFVVRLPAGPPAPTGSAEGGLAPGALDGREGER